jgi:hypothetical protein
VPICSHDLARDIGATEQRRRWQRSWRIRRG